MTKAEADAFATLVVEAARGFVARTLATFSPRLDEIERKVAVAPARGDKGDKGDAGEAGPAGRDGKDGVDGKDGAPGARGERGEPGPKGDPGARGERGEKGEIGARGEKGIGDVGPAGPQGDRGERGDPGLPGANGKDGRDGVDGQKGEKGDPGIAGDRGEIGPQGQRGEKGDPGIAGKDGADGINGKDGADGIAGKDGRDGINGKDGASAFELAKASGFVGSEVEWLLSLRGKDGRDGINGEKGIDGRDGRDGERGDPGRDALEIPFVDGLDERRSYPSGSVHCFNGGTFRAMRATDPLEGKAKPIDAGWMCLMCGVASDTLAAEDEGRFQVRTVRYSDGREQVERIKTVLPIYRGVWTEGKHSQGDIRLFDGSQWIAVRDTTDAPKGSPDWKLLVKSALK